MSKPIIITISGKAGSGKTTFANILENKIKEEGKIVKVINNADYLKYILREYYEWDGEKDALGRQLLQDIGTDRIRKNNPNFWVDNLIELVDAAMYDFDYIIVGDCRFPNEIERWKEEGYEVVSAVVRREENINLTEEQRNHISETALDDYTFDRIIVNYYKLIHLQRSATNFLRKIKGEVSE